MGGRPRPRSGSTTSSPTTSCSPTRPAPRGTTGSTATYAYYGKPTYNPNNEPDLLAPYMYLWSGQPAKTATVARAAFTLFTDGADGMTGNDDLGTMSAWYVFSSWASTRR